MILQFSFHGDLKGSGAQQSPQSSLYTIRLLSDFPLGGLHLRPDYCCTDFLEIKRVTRDDGPGFPSAIARVD